MLRLGIGPTIGDVVRMVAFFVVAVVYIALWLALATMLSVVTRRAATAALAGIAIWLVFTLFGGLIAGLVADTVHPVPDVDPTAEVVLANARLELNVRRFSPSELYQEATGVLLNPSRQSTGLIVEDDHHVAGPAEHAFAFREPRAGLVAGGRSRRRSRCAVRRRLHGLHASRGAGLIRPHRNARGPLLGPTDCCSGNVMTNVVGAVDTSSTRPPSGRSRFRASSSPRPWPR